MPGPRIAIVGGGSYTWSPQFIRDMVTTPELEGSSIVLHDIAPAPLELVFALGQMIIQAHGIIPTLEKTLDLDEALTGADIIGLCHEWLGVRHHLAALFRVQEDEVEA